MNPKARAEIRRQYREEGRPMGVFAIRCETNGRVLVGRSRNLPGALNGARFQLRLGSHRNPELQRDWKEHGEAAFRFEVLEELEREPGTDPGEDLAALEELWLGELKPYGERGYNRPRLAPGRNWLSLLPLL